MGATITIKTRLRVNGREYASVDELPPDLRRAYARAVAHGGDAHHHLMQSGGDATLGTATHSRIVFNGQEYADESQMPHEVRTLYDDALAALDAEMSGHSAEAVTTSAAEMTAPALAVSAARAESTSTRLIIIGVLIAALFVVSLALGH
jgi:hypothetical protein